MTRTIIICTLVLAALVAAQPHAPNIPKQFTCTACNFTTFVNGDTSSSPARLWYDAKSNKMRQDYMDHGDTVEFLQTYGENPGYVCWIYPDSKLCAAEPIYGPVTVDVFSAFSNDATFVATEMINGVQCDHWAITGDLETYDLWVQSASVNTPVRFRTTSFQGDWDQFDFHKLTVGQPDPTRFAVPSYCNVSPTYQ